MAKKRPITIHDGPLIWSGEHWIIGLRRADEGPPDAWISLFHTRFSAAGEGTVAQVLLADKPRLSVICTDNPGLTKFITDTFYSRSSVQDAEAKIVDATFRLEGDTQRDPAWVIETKTHRIAARWQVTEPPVIADGSFGEGSEHFTLLFFTDKATVELDGKRREGKPYPRDIWKPSIGGERSSCVFALAETFLALS